MSKTRDLDVAKERLVDSLSVARDATKTAVVEEIAPALITAVGAAREASGPMYAEAASRASEAASRASDAVAALRESEAASRAADAAKLLLASEAAARAKDTAKSLTSAGTSKSSKRKGRRKAAKALAGTVAVNRALGRKKKSSRTRWFVLGLIAAAGAAAAAKAKSKGNAPAAAYPPPVTTPPPAPSEAPIQASSVDLPIDEPAGGTAPSGS